jgi:4,5-DOPA dioxygenase extradiol
MTALPTLFVSHGSPMLALQPGATGAMFTALGRTLPKPRAILVISAHWMSEEREVSSATGQPIMHDFGGFPEALYRLDYPAPGAPDLALRVADLLQASGQAIRISNKRGLDHGAWVPLRMLYPDADIPVTQLSLRRADRPVDVLQAGRALRQLSDEEVLLMGSGSFTHNLYELRPSETELETPAYVREFSDWMRERIARGDVDALLAYRKSAPHAQRAHPTDEHLLPLFAALGAASRQSTPVHLHDAVTYGVLAMDAFAFGVPPGLALPGGVKTS